MKQDTITGLLDELEKNAGAISAILRNIAENPLKYVAADRRIEKGKEMERRTRYALRRGYPAGWVPLGMKPHR